jgi:kynureninase
MTNREDCLARDAADPIASSRQAFMLPEGVIYLDGNSLGPVTHASAARVQKVVQEEWGQGLIRSWNEAGWINYGTRIGDRIARLIGANDGEVVVGDSTSVNVFKQVATAVKLRPGRKVIVSEAGNFPTDLYMVQGLIDLLDDDYELRLVPEGGDLKAAIAEDTAAVLITQVDFKTGRQYDMADLTSAAHDKGALMIWDLCHSAGAVPLDLNGANVDLAVGCTYKYLNGGPGAPAFCFVAKRLQADARQPLYGWMGHAKPFDFSTDFVPAAGITRHLSGSHVILALSALDSALDVWDNVTMDQVRAKSLALTDLFIDLVESRCDGLGFELITPRDHAVRGSQASFLHKNAFPIMQALISKGVIGDYREPDVLRFGFTPLYTSFVDAWDAVEILVDIMANDTWKEDRFNVRGAVT